MFRWKRKNEDAGAGARFLDRPVVPTRKVNLDKLSVYRASQFPADGGPAPWLDSPDAEARIQARLDSGEIDSGEAELCRKWARDGYLILENFFHEETLDNAWNAYEREIASGAVTPPVETMFDGDTLPGRVANVHFHVEEMDQVMHDQGMPKIMSLLVGGKAIPFQTIVGHKSSQQLEHSDSIHMTTYPTGYLAANWIAFEDIHPDSGPLIYYPGSHKLPYVFSEELGMEMDQEYKEYRRVYEPAIQKVIKDNQLVGKYFLPKKGDVLLWHANLLHGGSKLNGSAHPSRKALVCHFFGAGCVCYHDLTGTPAHIQLNSTDKLYKHKGLPGNFSASDYLAANPDVARMGVDPGKHYLEHGRAEGRRLRP